MKRITIGRAADNDIVYNNSSVSGYHAYILINNGHVTLTDHSTNGTWINGKKLHNSTCNINKDDVILFPGNNRLIWDSIQNNINQTQYWNPKNDYNKQRESSYNNPQKPIGNAERDYSYTTSLTFTEAVSSVFSHFADFNGRARRSEYWWFALLCFLIELIPYLGWLWALIVLIPSLAVCVRRLHDIGKSGWYIFFALIPLVGFILLIIWLCQDSQYETNKYGPNPKIKMAV